MAINDTECPYGDQVSSNSTMINSKAIPNSNFKDSEQKLLHCFVNIELSHSNALDLIYIKIPIS